MLRAPGSNQSYGYLAFLLPFIILAIGYATRLVFPFGDRHILTVDLYHQYAPFLNELRDKLLSGDSLFYSFRGGTGVNFYSLFAYYLASPLNLILLIFPKAFLAEGILMLTLIKVSLAGYTFNLLLRRAYLRTGPLSIAFATMYALSSYQMAYGWNVMWLDALYTMPLVILGLILLVREKNYWLYPISVGYLLFVNYYMAMFVLIFTFFYYPVVLFTFGSEKGVPARLLTSLKTLGLTLLGIGMSAVLVWPTYKALQLTSAAGDSFPKTVESTFDLIDYFAQHVMLLEPTVRDGMPNLYGGILLLLLVPVYFFSARIPLWRRVSNLGMLAFLILSFNTNILNFLWHGTHFPNQLPYRNSFVYIFLLIFILYDALPSVKTFGNRELGYTGMLAIILVLLAAPETTLKFTTFTVYATIFFLIVYTIVLSRFKLARQRRQPIAFVLLSVIFFEMVLHTGGSLHYLDKNEYFGLREGYAYGTTAEAIRKASDMLQESSDDAFYRTEIVPDKTSNDPFLYGFYGSTIFASTMRKDGVTFFKNMGYSSNAINSYKYDGQTILMDSLLGIRYLIYREQPKISEQARTLTLKNDDGGVYVYENRHALPLAYMVDPAVLSFTSHDRSPFENQTSLLEAMLPNTEAWRVLTPVSIDLGQHVGGVLGPTETPGVYHFGKDLPDQEATFSISWDTSNGANTYLGVDLRGHKGRHADILIDNNRFTAPVRRSGVIDLGYVPANASVTVHIVLESDAASSGEFELYVSQLSVPDLERTVGLLWQDAMYVRSHRSTHIEGTVDAAKDGMLFIAIPFDPGWTISVDGSAVEITEVDKSMMAIPVSAGQHEIVMRFKPDGFTTGLLVTLASFLVFALLLAALRLFCPVLGRRKAQKLAKKRAGDGLADSLDSGASANDAVAAGKLPVYIEESED